MHPQNKNQPWYSISIRYYQIWRRTTNAITTIGFVSKGPTSARSVWIPCGSSFTSVVGAGVLLAVGAGIINSLDGIRSWAGWLAERWSDLWVAAASGQIEEDEGMWELYLQEEFSGDFP